MIVHCPFCSNQFDRLLLSGIKYCDNCDRMVESTKKNILLSAFRICLKSTGKNMEKIKFDLKLNQEDFDLISKYLDECYNFEDFQKIINQLEL